MKTETEITEVTEKLCLTCGLVKPLAAFSRCAARKDGLQSACKCCFRIKYRHPKGRDPVCRNATGGIHRRGFHASIDHQMFDDFMRIGL